MFEVGRSAEGTWPRRPSGDTNHRRPHGRLHGLNTTVCRIDSAPRGSQKTLHRFGWISQRQPSAANSAHVTARAAKAKFAGDWNEGDGVRHLGEHWRALGERATFLVSPETCSASLVTALAVHLPFWSWLRAKLRHDPPDPARAYVCRHPVHPPVQPFYSAAAHLPLIFRVAKLTPGIATCRLAAVSSRVMRDRQKERELLKVIRLLPSVFWAISGRLFETCPNGEASIAPLRSAHC